MPFQARRRPQPRPDFPPAVPPAQPGVAARHGFPRLVYAAILTRQHNGIEAAALLEQAHWSSSEPVGEPSPQIQDRGGDPPALFTQGGFRPTQKRFLNHGPAEKSPETSVGGVDLYRDHARPHHG